jgi:HemY protein
MKTLFVWGVILLFAVALTSFALMDLGQVSLRWDVWQLDTSASLLIAFSVVLLVVLYYVIRFWSWLLRLPRTIANYWQMRRYKKAQQTLSKGLIAQEAADWAKAEKQLIKTAQLSENGLVHYLTAAKLADQQQAIVRRNQYLEQARQRFPEQALTIGLVEARLLKTQDPLSATVILAKLHQMQPNHTAVLLEYVALLKQASQAEKLIELLPVVKKYGKLSSADFTQLEMDIHSMKLAKFDGFSELNAYWLSLASKLRMQPQIMAAYTEQAMRFGEFNGLAESLEKAIKNQWDERLVYWYGRIQFGPAYDRLKKAQAWLKQYPNSAVLLLTVGRLACQSQMWGQAHGYLRQSLTLQPELETFHALAECYESEGQDSEAALVYKQAMLQLDQPKTLIKSV